MSAFNQTLAEDENINRLVSSRLSRFDREYFLLSSSFLLTVDGLIQALAETLQQQNSGGSGIRVVFEQT